MNNLDKLKQRESEMLINFDKFCNENGIKYSLGFGTMLGAVRHKGFIPWDDDIDIIMTRDNYYKLKKLKDKFPSSLFLQNNKTDSFQFDICMSAKIRDNNSIVEFNKNYNSGAFIDVFVLDNISSKKIIRKIQRIVYLGLRFVQYRGIQRRYSIFRIKFIPNMLEKIFLLFFNKGDKFYFYWNKKEIFLSYDELYPLENIEFENNLFPVFNNKEKILKFLYNDYMKLPPENERVQSHIDVSKVILNKNSSI